MALNLSTLTNPATSGGILAEALTTADFLDPVPILKNLARGSQKGGDAKQTTALNQPRALPLIKNPSGNLGGYLYIPDVSGNYATGPSVTIGSNETWEAEVDMVITQFGNYIMPMGGGDYNSGFGLLLYSDGAIRSYSKSIASSYSASGITLGTPLNIKYGYGAVGLYVKINDVIVSQTLNHNQSSSITHTLELAQNNNLSHAGNYAIQKAKLTVNSAVVFDCDFNGSTSIRHGDTKFNCVGGPVSLIKVGNDPVTVVKKGVLRFDGADDGLNGLFNQTFTEGYMFASFSVHGDGGESGGRIFTGNSTGAFDYQTGGFAIRRYNATSQIQVRWNGGAEVTHSDVFNGERGDFLLESPLRAGDQNSKINNADADDGACSLPNPVSSEEFNICTNSQGDVNGCIDLEYLALFSADSVPDEATATKIRDYINKRNNVFSLVDNSYYFFDPQKASFTGNFTGSNTLDGYITGSDLGDTDVRSNLTLEQSTLNDQPSTDGYTITFNDSAEHLEFENGASQNLTGWQVVGTSLGTFVYRVNANAVTELNLLGNLGNVNQRKTGSLYGVILIPESATGKDIEDARKLLIDRGSADASPATIASAYWAGRTDIIEFKNTDFPLATSLSYAWDGCNNMTQIGTLNAPVATNFNSAWKSCSALTSFPAGAKLGTEATNVNFQDAWRSTGLTSFSTPLPTATNLRSAFEDAVSLVSFNSQLPLATNALFAWDNCSSLTSFDVSLPSLTAMYRAWAGCSSLTDFSVDVFSNWNPQSISSGVFDFTWQGCTSLTAQSVENILTSIDASGKYATSTGASGGSALTDAGIDITYNVATGSLSAATNSAIDSLSGKGWEVYINGVLVIPNILDLAPAAAYSLRSFDANADPNVVNVRRSSDGATSDFKASEVSDGTLVAFVGAGNDGHVTTWYDQGGTNHAAQATASSQPKIVDGGTLVTEGGLAAMDFGLESDSLSLDVSGSCDVASIFTVTKPNTSSGNSLLGVSGAEYIAVEADTLAYRVTSFDGLPFANDFTQQLAVLIREDGAGTQPVHGYRNGVVSTEDPCDTNQELLTGNVSIGRRATSDYYDGTIQEIVIYDSDQSANRTGIENNINDHFDIYS